jgi:Arc/MetJ-type ribon-helix-helix transcriptional regulator
MSANLPLRLGDEELAELEAAVRRGAWPNRSAALRAGLRLLLRAERERLAGEEYRRAYAAHPPEGELDAISSTALADAER